MGTAFSTLRLLYRSLEASMSFPKNYGLDRSGQGLPKHSHEIQGHPDHQMTARNDLLIHPAISIPGTYDQDVRNTHYFLGNT
jgi:hypothetical protein